MADPQGFLKAGRQAPAKRPVETRVCDFDEFEEKLSASELSTQASRCMQCGIPYCHQGCPLGNYIPDWNHHSHAWHMRDAINALHATNNFPEFTGRVCPAPCEQACVLDLHGAAVTIKSIEKHIIDHAWEQGWVLPEPPDKRTGKRVAVVGSGPAGLTVAQQLARMGHDVHVFERDARCGGLLRYGIPDFKLNKQLIDRRLTQMQVEGVHFHTQSPIDADAFAELQRDFDALCLSTGALRPRDLDIPGRHLGGVHLAMDFLKAQNQVVAKEISAPAPLSAAGKRVVILGGGDTGADCVGTSHRQGAAKVYHIHYKPEPPKTRNAHMPWPWWPAIAHPSSSHEEGGARGWNLVARAFIGNADQQLAHIECDELSWDDVEGRLQMGDKVGAPRRIPVDMALIAIGFSGSDFAGVPYTQQGTIAVDASYRTSLPKVYACGDATRGASLVVWAIWEGRAVAHQIDLALSGRSALPVVPNERVFDDSDLR